MNPPLDENLAQVRLLVAIIERHGHQSMVSQLKFILRMCGGVLSEFQREEVELELEWRKEETQRLTLYINNARKLAYRGKRPTNDIAGKEAQAEDGLRAAPPAMLQLPALLQAAEGLASPVR